jgi:uncharacterized membrane protein YbaN (DUF454 family)
MLNNLRKPLLVTAGVLSVGLAAVGVFLPLIPTTPFLLLAAACFVRSSDRLYQWLIHHRWFGAYIRNYREHRAIPLRSKIIVVALLWASVGYTAARVMSSAFPRVVLLTIAAAVTIHVLRFRTLTEEMLAADRAAERARRAESTSGES